MKKTSYFLWINNASQGSFTVEELQEKRRSGQLPSSALMCEEGSDDWKPLGTFTDVFEAAMPRRISSPISSAPAPRQVLKTDTPPPPLPVEVSKLKHQSEEPSTMKQTFIACACMILCTGFLAQRLSVKPVETVDHSQAAAAAAAEAEVKAKASWTRHREFLTDKLNKVGSETDKDEVLWRLEKIHLLLERAEARAATK